MHHELTWMEQVGGDMSYNISIAYDVKLQMLSRQDSCTKKTDMALLLCISGRCVHAGESPKHSHLDIQKWTKEDINASELDLK